VEGVMGVAITSWVWFNKINQFFKGMVKANGTPNGLDQRHVHLRSFQTIKH
jgi:hypothetical protein